MYAVIRPRSRAAAATAVRDPLLPSTHMRILLVEDDTVIAQSLAKGLREQAYAVDVATDGRRRLSGRREPV